MQLARNLDFAKGGGLEPKIKKSRKNWRGGGELLFKVGAIEGYQSRCCIICSTKRLVEGPSLQFLGKKS